MIVVMPGYFLYVIKALYFALGVQFWMHLMIQDRKNQVKVLLGKSHLKK